MSTRKEKILYAIKHNPLLIPVLHRDTSINKGFLYRELTKAVPCRIGIEFELSGDFRKKFCEKYNKVDDKGTISKLKSTIDKTMAKFYGVYEINSDYFSNITDDTIYEIRVSIKDFHQLSGLYKFMQDMKEFCKLHEHGGIHIHVDMTKYPMNYSDKLTEVRNYITNRLDEIAKIFPKYTGTCNKKAVGIAHKETWVNISRLSTLEFRIAPLTFDYSTLINWILKVIKFRQNLIHKCRLVKHPKKINNGLTNTISLNVEDAIPTEWGRQAESYLSTYNLQSGWHSINSASAYFTNS